ncbi:Peptidyl-prolyl cis-trans isomerase B [Penicillium frequentans]|nr:Peptidyl-prolyl cis-trans isomerase B [Penicillium glabrum]
MQHAPVILLFFLLLGDEYDDYPTDEAPVDSYSFSMRPMLIFLVLVAIVGFYFYRRRNQQGNGDDDYKDYL